MSKMIVDAWSREKLREQYDIFIVALGYEKRARYIAETLGIDAKRKVASGFPDRQVLSYGANEKYLKKHGFAIEEVQENDFRSWIKGALIDALAVSCDDDFLVCVDISSFSGYRTALILEALRECSRTKNVVVDFLYSLAKFSKPVAEIAQNQHVGPVLPAFAGWTPEPESPPLAIVGLGYEADKALGAVEHIQASKIWTFIPESPIDDYLPAVEKANSFFLEPIPLENILFYRVDRPWETFVRLESLIHGLNEQGNPILLPFGPKIFGLCSLLVACLYPGIAVWRVSAGSKGDAHNRYPSGEYFGLRVRFQGTT